MKIVTISDSEVIRDLTNNLKVTLNRVDQQSLMDAFRDEKKVEESKYILDMYKAENYAAVLRNKTDALTLIAINDIFKAHDTKYLFIPNIMGVLRKYKGDIINPNEFYLASKKESKGQDKEYESFISGCMFDQEYIHTNKEITSPGYYIKGNFLVIAQPSLITWKIEEKYVEKYNKELYDEFFEANKDNKVFGKKENRSPCTADFLRYIEENKYLFPDVEFKKPEVLIYYVSIPTLKLNITNNESLKHRDIKIHESIANKLL